MDLDGQKVDLQHYANWIGNLVGLRGHLVELVVHLVEHEDPLVRLGSYLWGLEAISGCEWL